MALQVVDYGSVSGIDAPVYLDANVVVSILDVTGGRPGAAQQAFVDILADQAQIILSTQVIDEVWWALLRELSGESGGTVSRKIETVLGRYQRELEDATAAIFGWPRLMWADESRLQVRPFQPFLRGLLPGTDLARYTDSMLDAMLSCRLAPRDALHLRLALDAGASSLVTEDSDFERVSGEPLGDLTVVKLA